MRIPLWLDDLLDLGRDLLVAVLVMAVGAGALVLGLKAIVMEPGCNQRAAGLGVVDGDYRLLSDACYLTLKDGRKLPADQVRAVEDLRR